MIPTTGNDCKRAEDALRESEDHYRDLVEHSHDLICTHDLEGILLSVNEGPLRILGYSRDELLNKPLRDFVTPEAKSHCDAYLAQIQRDGFAKGLLPVLTKSGEVRLWEFNNSLRRDGVSQPIVRGLAHDVTEQKRAEAALRKSEEKFSKAFHSSPVEMAITTFKEGRVIDVNGSFERFTGFAREEVIGRTTLELGLWINACDRAAVVEEIKKNGRVLNCEIQMRAKSGEIRSKLYSAELIEISREQCLLAAGQDITERKRTEEELRRLSGHLLHFQDEERRRIARELHDATGQDLVALSTFLGQLHDSLPSSRRKLRKLVSECQTLADRSIREVRTLSYSLHPPMLDEAGLGDAIRHFVEGFVKRSGIQVDLELSPQIGRLERNVELALFRVVQESLTNIQRHSGSLRAAVQIDLDLGALTLKISDRGHGAACSVPGRTGEPMFKFGVGIPSMQERVKLIGGHLDIDSGPGGTTVRVTIPFEGEPHEKAAHPDR
jgi:two-component system, NarL family, sensor kinase